MEPGWYSDRKPSFDREKAVFMVSPDGEKTKPSMAARALLARGIESKDRKAIPVE